MQNASNERSVGRKRSYRIDPSRRSSFHGDSILEKSPSMWVGTREAQKASRSGEKGEKDPGVVIKKKEKGGPLDPRFRRSLHKCPVWEQELSN